MEWKWALICYLVVGILLAEGLIYNNRKTGKPTILRHYLIALILGPSVGLIIILVRGLMGGKTK